MELGDLEEEILLGRGQQSMNSVMFAVMAAVSGSVVAFFTYKLVSSLRQKHRVKEEKKKQKLQKKEKETQRKQKKK